MKKTLLSFVFIQILIIRTDAVWAQQDPNNTHYAFNRMMYNPAVAGANGKYSLTALSHYQYLGYEERTVEFWPSDLNDPNSKPVPKAMGSKTQMFSFCAPVTRYGGLGIGFINDRLGYESSRHLKIDVAARLPLGSDPVQENNPYFSLGFEVNFLQKGLDGSRLRKLMPGDPSIPNSRVNDNHAVFGAGAYYINPMSENPDWCDLWAGVSVSNLNHPLFTFGDSNVVFSTPSTHTYIMGGITRVAFLGNSNLNFHPSLMIRYNTVVQLDMTSLVEYRQKLWAGLAYRTMADALSVMIGYSFSKRLRGLRIGYSYDLTLTRILSVSSGTHELQLNYCFPTAGE